jgi:hypothetical protein
MDRWTPGPTRELGFRTESLHGHANGTAEGLASKRGEAETQANARAT